MPITIDELTPENLLIVKETVEAELNNPCIGCVWEHETSEIALDFCHGGVEGKPRCTR